MRKILMFIATTLFASCLLGLVACGETPSMKSTKGSVANESAQSSPLRVTFVDVGKGDCTLIQSGSEVVLIDTGYQNTADDVLARLKKDGVNHLDAMIITHYDRDHIGGIRTIGEDVDVGTVYLPGYEGGDKNYRSCIKAVKELGVPTQLVTEELALNVGGAHLVVYPSDVAYVHDTGNGEGNDNDASLVATLSNGRDSFLFAGDLEEDGIDAYLKAGHGRFGVLKMPHHGEHASNTDEFLESVRPQFVVITDAENDPASKKTLKLLQSMNAETYRTSVDGTVVVDSDGSGTYKVSTQNEL